MENRGIFDSFDDTNADGRGQGETTSNPLTSEGWARVEVAANRSSSVYMPCPHCGNLLAVEIGVAAEGVTKPVQQPLRRRPRAPNDHADQLPTPLSKRDRRLADQGRRLRVLRETAHLSLSQMADLAKRADIRISIAQLSRYETGAVVNLKPSVLSLYDRLPTLAPNDPEWIRDLKAMAEQTHEPVAHPGRRNDWYRGR